MSYIYIYMERIFLMFLDHTQRRTSVGRTPLDDWSARRRDLYMTAHNTHNRQTSMPPAGFEPTISAGERPQTYALDRAATGTGRSTTILHVNRYDFSYLDCEPSSSTRKWKHRPKCQDFTNLSTVCTATSTEFVPFESAFPRTASDTKENFWASKMKETAIKFILLRITLTI